MFAYCYKYTSLYYLLFNFTKTLHWELLQGNNFIGIFMVHRKSIRNCLVNVIIMAKNNYSKYLILINFLGICCLIIGICSFIFTDNDNPFLLHKIIFMFLSLGLMFSPLRFYMEEDIMIDEREQPNFLCTWPFYMFALYVVSTSSLIIYFAKSIIDLDFFLNNFFNAFIIIILSIYGSLIIFRSSYIYLNGICASCKETIRIFISDVSNENSRNTEHNIDFQPTTKQMIDVQPIKQNIKTEKIQSSYV